MGCPIPLRFCASALVWLILPATLSFGLASNSDSATALQFRPTLANELCAGLFISATASLAFVHTLVALAQYRLLSLGSVFSDEQNGRAASVDGAPLACHPLSALYGFELVLLLVLAALNFAAGMVASGAVWSLAFVSITALQFNCYRWYSHVQETQRLSSTDAPPVSTLSRSVQKCLLLLGGLAFLASSVIQSWSVPPGPFVFRFAFMEAMEASDLVWRGICLSYAIGFFTCLFGSFNQHSMFLLHLAVSGLLHAGFMLISNLAHGLANSDREHLLGDIGGWFFVGLFSATVLVGIPLTSAQPAACIDESDPTK